MKKRLFVLISFLFLTMNGCTTSDKQVSTTSDKGVHPITNAVSTANKASVTDSDGEFGEEYLEKAIADCSDFFISRLPEKRNIAILDIETPTKACSDFIIEELWKHFQKTGKYRMADQQNIRRIQEQLIFQTSGYVSDESAVSLGRLSGAQNIIYGKLIKIGDFFRLNLYLTEVETGESVIETKNINIADPHLKNLLEPGNLASRIESAITDMSSNLDQRLLIGIDKIEYANTGTVTEFSRYLENQIRFSASRLYTRYAVADEMISREFAIKSSNPSWVDNSPDRIMAIVKGSYTSDGRNGAEVTLSLHSTDRGRIQLGVCRFNVTEKEMKDLNLSLLPANYGGSIDNYQRVRRKLEEFDTNNNAFEFIAHPGRPDALYRDGDYITFTLHSARDCYFLVQFLFVDGEVADMYPTDRREINFIKAGETRILPDRGRIRLSPPFGEEYVLISAFGEQIAITNETVTLEKANFKTRGANKEEVPEGGLIIDQGIAPVARTKFNYTVLP